MLNYVCASEWAIHEHLIPSEDRILNLKGIADPKVSMTVLAGLFHLSLID